MFPTTITLKIKRLDESAQIPTVGRADDACFDLSALEDTHFAPGEIKLVRTGLAIEIPRGHRANIYVRSSTPLKKGFILANGVGIIDYGYRGELFIQLMNVATQIIRGLDTFSGLPTEPFGVFISNDLHLGDRVGQLEIVVSIFASDINLEVTDDLGATDRGTSGIGSTGG